jgi:hypothetical protein
MQGERTSWNEQNAFEEVCGIWMDFGGQSAMVPQMKKKDRATGRRRCAL